jgi:hypothetical protein
LALACPTCNYYKLDRTQGLDPATRNVVRLFNPRSDVWDEHFAWTADRRTLIGLTPRGRATIAELRMNHPELHLRARAIWFKAGLLP